MNRQKENRDQERHGQLRHAEQACEVQSERTLRPISVNLSLQRRDPLRHGGCVYRAAWQGFRTSRRATAANRRCLRPASYFDAFVRDTGDGLGGMLDGPFKPDVVTVHCYSDDYLRLYRDRGERNPYKMIDYVRGWNSTISMKVTEAGINRVVSDRGARYRDFGTRVGNARSSRESTGEDAPRPAVNRRPSRDGTPSARSGHRELGRDPRSPRVPRPAASGWAAKVIASGARATGRGPLVVNRRW
jgi:hypothetical protein